MYCFFMLHQFLGLFKCIEEALNGTFQFVYSVLRPSLKSFKADFE